MILFWNLWGLRYIIIIIIIVTIITTIIFITTTIIIFYNNRRICFRSYLWFRFIFNNLNRGFGLFLCCFNISSCFFFCSFNFFFCNITVSFIFSCIIRNNSVIMSTLVSCFIIICYFFL